MYVFYRVFLDCGNYVLLCYVTVGVAILGIMLIVSFFTGDLLADHLLVSVCVSVCVFDHVV